MLIAGDDHWVSFAKAQDTLTGHLESAREDTNKVMLYWKAGANTLYQDGHTTMKYFRAGKHRQES